MHLLLQQLKLTETATEDTAYSVDVLVTSQMSMLVTALTYTATGMPSTMTMSTAGVLSGTPANADVGTSTVVSHSN